MNEYENEDPDEKLPRDFELPYEPDQIDDKVESVFDLIMSGADDIPANGMHCSGEEIIALESVISLFHSYMAYVKEVDPSLHDRAIAFSSDTVELHPNVILTDQDGQPLDRFKGRAKELGRPEDGGITREFFTDQEDESND